MGDRLTKIKLDSSLTNSPTSTAQSDALLTTTTTTTTQGYDSSEPTLLNKQAPKSPLDATSDSTAADSSILEHSSPESREQSTSSTLAGAQTSTAGSIYSNFSIAELTEAASAGEANAQFELGKRFYQGIGVPVNYEEAVRWYSESANQGYFKAQHNLAGMYYDGVGVEVDMVKAAELFEKAANQDAALSQYNLSLLYQGGKGVEQNDVKAFSWCLKAAEQGHAEAQYELGVKYQYAQGVHRDPSLEFYWFSQAADQGHAEAQYELGNIYRFGRKEASIDKDLSKALDLFRKAADQHNAQAQCQLGWIYQHGTDSGFDISKDYDKAFHWLQLAADQGDLGGQESLGEMYQKGHGVKQSDQEAAIWNEKAAEQGSKSAQHKLALAYKEGNGVKKDLNRSVYWQMKCSLNDDYGDCIDGTFLDISLSAGLIDFIAQNLIEGKEFKKVTKLKYAQKSFSDNEIFGICALLRKNLEINSFVLNSYNILSNTNLQLIIDALDANTHLTEFIYDEYYVDSKLKEKIAALLARNVAIAELRQYVLDFRLVDTSNFALDPLKIIVDKTIVLYLINGISIEETKKAIDELFAGASYYELEAEKKNKLKQ